MGNYILYLQFVPYILSIFQAFQEIFDICVKRKKALNDKVKAIAANQNTEIQDKLIAASEGAIKTQAKVIANTVLKAIEKVAAKMAQDAALKKFVSKAEANPIHFQLLQEKVVVVALNTSDAIDLVATLVV